MYESDGKKRLESDPQFVKAVRPNGRQILSYARRLRPSKATKSSILFHHLTLIGISAGGVAGLVVGPIAMQMALLASRRVRPQIAAIILIATIVIFSITGGALGGRIARRVPVQEKGNENPDDAA
jgi:hypothetical protein